MTSSSADYFISYAGADVAWARWVDWVLRDLGCSTRIQVYDFQPGESFVARIQRELEVCNRVVCLLSEAYFRSRWASEEWQAALTTHKLWPVRIAECKPPGLLASRNYLDLSGLEESVAREAFSVALKQLAGADGRPSERPPFPGAAENETPARFPGRRGDGSTLALPPIWNLPQQRNRYFTGRNAALDSLHARLHAGIAAAPTHVVKGLGGVGKTQLAIEYAYRYAVDYDAIWWLRAEDRTTLSTDYAALAVPLGLPSDSDQGRTVQSVRYALSARARFLLIFDNALEGEELDSFLPQGPNQQVIITTRSQTWPRAELARVDTLSAASAQDFLLKRTGRSDTVAAARIAELLGQLPLALEQAAAYIEARDKSLSDYARLLETHGLRVLERGLAFDHKQSVGTTWSLSLDALRDCPGAADLLNFCAFLAPEAIHLADLRAANEQLARGTEQALPESLSALFRDELALDDAKAALLRYSLVSAEGDALTAHRLVQQVTRERLDEGQRRLWLGAAQRAINVLFPDNPSAVRVWPLCARLLPHGRAAVDEAHGPLLEVEACVRLLNQMGLYLKTRADYAEAEPLYRRALALGEHSLGAQHRAVATCLNDLAELLRATERFSEAEPLYRRALAIDESTLGQQNPAVARDLNNLALLLKKTGRAEQAEPLYRRALAIDESTLGPNAPIVAIRLNNLAELLRAAKRFDEAHSLYLRALAIDEKELGTSDPAVAIDLNNLAALLRDTGQLAEAEPLYCRALEICQASLGLEHPTTLRIGQNLAALRARRSSLPPGGADR